MQLPPWYVCKLRLLVEEPVAHVSQSQNRWRQCRVALAPAAACGAADVAVAVAWAHRNSVEGDAVACCAKSRDI